MALRGSGFKVLGVWWLVGTAVGLGTLLVILGHVRGGGQVMAAGFAAAAVVRLVRTDRGGGGLTVRSKWLDISMLLAASAATLYASATVNLMP